MEEAVQSADDAVRTPSACGLASGLGDSFHAAVHLRTWRAMTLAQYPSAHSSARASAGTQIIVSEPLLDDGGSTAEKVMLSRNLAEDFLVGTCRCAVVATTADRAPGQVQLAVYPRSACNVLFLLNNKAVRGVALSCTLFTKVTTASRAPRGRHLAGQALDCKYEWR